MENERLSYNSVVSPRALREIYLMPFMLAQKYAKPWAYMTACVTWKVKIYTLITVYLSIATIV